ncbi:MAG: phosphoribosylformylglycinamidine synthase subunit PurS [Deltaproteobacteria bacterium]|nr:phosphoribosylformylglycinamidine synthase subunit PurS [Deltaproteobacteria bacterium]
MRVQVLVRLKGGVLDVQGKAIERGLADNGFQDLNNIRVGKLIELDVEAASEDSARKQVETVCQKLLANPIIENYEIRFL